jgi:hypothetical protein
VIRMRRYHLPHKLGPDVVRPFLTWINPPDSARSIQNGINKIRGEFTCPPPMAHGSADESFLTANLGT